MHTIYNYFNTLRAFPVWVLLFLLVLGTGAVQAQNSGRITGLVTDESSGEPLIGASVMIEGTSLGAATSVEGEYTIRRVSPGDYTLLVAYIGYQQQEIPVTVTAGETVEVDVSLSSVAVEGEEINITAQASGQAGAINEQLASNTITNVVSAEKIQDIPDINAAESVGRLSGVSVVRSGGEGQKVAIRGLSPQYNVVMVNGVRMQSTDPNNRSVDLNMIAPNVLSGISVTKALTADMDADAVGGTVNLKVGKAKEGFHANFSMQSGYASMAYTPEETYGNYRLSGLVTNRFLDSKLGVQVSGFLDDQNRNADVLGSGYYTNEDNIEDGFVPLYLSNVTINDRVTNRQRAGGSLVLDYELENGSLILNNFVSSLNQHQVTQNNTFTTGYDWRGWTTTGEFTNTVINNALQGEFEFGDIQMDFSLSNSISLQRTPNDLRSDIRPESGGVQGLRSDSANLNQMNPTNFLNAVTVIPEGKIVTGVSSFSRDVNVAAQAAALNLQRPFNLTDNVTGYVKVGGKYERNTRDNDEEVLYIDTDRGGLAGNFIDLLKVEWPELGLEESDSHIPDALFRDPDYKVESFLSGNEGITGERFYDLTSIDKMKRMEQIARDNGYYLSAPLGSNVYDYDYTRNFHAFYAMAEINIGKYVTLQPGIRYEQFGFDYTADSTVVFGRLTTPGENYYNSETIESDVTEGENWFPQMQVRIKPTDWLDVRLARTESIIYPDYRAISPYVYFDTYASPSLNLGNPSLKPSTSDNYDAYLSIYENHIGLFTAGVFYKSIENFIVPIEYLTKDASKINNRVSLPQNGDPTTINTWTNLERTSNVKGVELEWQTHFWYLPEVLQGLVFSINYTHIQSETYYPNYYTERRGNPPFFQYVTVDTVRSGRLLNQPDDILNLTVGYDLGGFSARISYQYTDNILRGINSTYDELDSYTAPYKRWDFTARQKLPWLEGLEAYLNVNNITNTPDRQFSSTRRKLSNVQYYGRTAALGVRYSF
ncbi:TonB-dependent receptor [Gracilimonas mengyeensis]|uniref:TonB-dependent receptor n=1 Tax=Gracilimonas mengyeensis TaxID=1302730 RepID=A0A521C373_9BACT|nr:TonB-dependent receptor [Gracilimonas mengyeensis]SMO53848.1 TonB-dependent receptor [Gracilimonas mengyeensis]